MFYLFGLFIVYGISMFLLGRWNGKSVGRSIGRSEGESAGMIMFMQFIQMMDPSLDLWNQVRSKLEEFHGMSTDNKRHHWEQFMMNNI